MEGDPSHNETPAREVPEGTKKTNRRKATSTQAPPRTRSKTTNTSSSHSGNASIPNCSPILSDVLHSVMHSSLLPRILTWSRFHPSSTPSLLSPLFSPPRPPLTDWSIASPNPPPPQMVLVLIPTISDLGSEPVCLDLAPPQVVNRKPKRGRPSKINSAIQYAVANVAQGRQYTIERALRAIEPLENGSP